MAVAWCFASIFDFAKLCRSSIFPRKTWVIRWASSGDKPLSRSNACLRFTFRIWRRLTDVRDTHNLSLLFFIWANWGQFFAVTSMASCCFFGTQCSCLTVVADGRLRPLFLDLDRLARLSWLSVLKSFVWKLFVGKCWREGGLIRGDATRGLQSFSTVRSHGVFIGLWIWTDCGCCCDSWSSSVLLSARFGSQSMASKCSGNSGCTIRQIWTISLRGVRPGWPYSWGWSLRNHRHTHLSCTNVIAIMWQRCDEELMFIPSASTWTWR